MLRTCNVDLFIFSRASAAHNATTLQRHNATTHVGLTTLQRGSDVSLTALRSYGGIALPIIFQSAHRRSSSSEGFPALVCAACFLHGDEACALTVCRLITTTIDAVSEAKSPTESLFRSQRSALGVLHFLSK